MVLFDNAPFIGQKELVVTFEVEGGFTNQLLDVVFVTMVALALKPCSIVLPPFSTDGTQVDGRDVRASQTVEFGYLFDLSTFENFLAQQKVRVLDAHHILTSGTSCRIYCRRDKSLEHCLSRIKTGFSRNCVESNVHVDAPFLHEIWSTKFLHKHRNGFLQVIEQIRPSNYVAAEVDNQHSYFLQNSVKKCMNFVHARTERDWHQHCLKWHPYRSEYAYNCYVGFEEILKRVVELDLRDCDVHLTYDEDQAISTMGHSLVANSLDVNVIDQPDRSHDNKGREVKAAVQFFLALRAEKFIGNSVSTFSAVIILRRQQMNLWSSQYNRGPIPLASFVPGYRLPWVFTVSGNDIQYDSMMKVAVESALSQTTLIPHAIIRPSEVFHQRTTWLRKRGVNMVISTSGWEQHVQEILRSSSVKDVSSSHLYGDMNKTLATYARLQIAHLKELAHLEHILYTDVDVYFRKDISMLGNYVSLPDSIQMGFEILDTFPLNAGVFLASVPFLRETRDALHNLFMAASTVNDETYGPGDQGLLNNMYEKQLHANGPLQSSLNAKPYKKFSDDTTILHFHGPKLSDYAQYSQRGSVKKSFVKLCRSGFTNGFCKYFREMVSSVTEKASLRDQMSVGEYQALAARCKIRVRD